MLNPIEEQKFDELRDKCRELKVPLPPEIMIGLKVHDKHGFLIFDDTQRGHSWTRNYYNAIFLNSGGAASGSGYVAGHMQGKRVDTNITTGNILYAGVVGYNGGLYVGTGDTAFNPQDYILASAITNGTGTGQFVHNAMNAGTASYNGGTKIWTGTRSRIFNNNSGAGITVKETGLYGGIDIFCYERSVLSPTVAVPNLGQLTATYEISMDFSAID